MKLSKITIPEKAQSKWEHDVQFVNHPCAWEKVYKALHSTTNDVKLRWLQIRIIHRILPTNRLLNLFGIKESSKCERCSSPTETILHLFWECKSSKEFWVEEKFNSGRAFHSRGSVVWNDGRKRGLDGGFTAAFHYDSKTLHLAV